jgi:hypothetical protein
MQHPLILANKETNLLPLLELHRKMEYIQSKDSQNIASKWDAFLQNMSKTSGNNQGLNRLESFIADEYATVRKVLALNIIYHYSLKKENMENEQTKPSSKLSEANEQSSHAEPSKGEFLTIVTKDILEIIPKKQTVIDPNTFRPTTLITNEEERERNVSSKPFFYSF